METSARDLIANKIIKQTIYEDIYKLVKDGRIKSITVDNSVFDYSNIPEDGWKYNVYISKKYIPMLKQYNISDLNQFLNSSTYNVQLINNDDKFIAFYTTFHAKKQFIKRFIYLYLMTDRPFEFNQTMNNILEKYFNKFISIVKYNNLISTDTEVDSCIEDIVLNSVVFKPEKTGRLRDKIAFTRRHNDLSGSKYFAHPFLFIVNEEHLVTVELYSSSFDFRKINKFTGDDRAFYKFLEGKGL